MKLMPASKRMDDQLNHNISLSNAEKKLLDDFISLLISSVHNLTAIKDFDTAYSKHIEDVLIPMQDFDLKGRYIDVGTGGGIPGIVCAIAFPESNWVLLDSVKKKIGEIDSFIQKLNLNNVTTFSGRVEEVPSHYLRNFDGVFFRGVARGDICLEYARPLLNKNGKAYLYKGPSWETEEAYSEKAAKILKLEQTENILYTLKDSSVRRLVIYEAKGNCPKGFPRNTGIARKKPLGD